jgi:hypothetical protein
MSSTVQNDEFKSDVAAQQRPKYGVFWHYVAVAIIVASILATLAWIAFLFWAALRIVGVL